MTATSVIGSIVKYNNSYRVVVGTVDNGRKWVLLNPLDNTKVQVVYTPTKCEATGKSMRQVTVRGFPYLISDKGTIVSLRTNRVMNWDSNHGLRKEVLAA